VDGSDLATVLKANVWIVLIETLEQVRFEKDHRDFNNNQRNDDPAKEQQESPRKFLESSILVVAHKHFPTA